MAESIFEKSLKERQKNQEEIKAAVGLDSEAELVTMERMYFRIPSDLKVKFTDYCKRNYITPSAQLRLWIAQNCND